MSAANLGFAPVDCEQAISCKYIRNANLSMCKYIHGDTVLKDRARQNCVQAISCKYICNVKLSASKYIHNGTEY